MNSVCCAYSFLPLYQIFGISFISETNKQRVTITTFGILQIVVLIVTISTILQYGEQFFVQTDPVSKLTDIVQWISTIFCHIILIGESLKSYPVERKLWKMIHHIHIEVKKLKNSWEIDAKIRKISIIKILLLQLLTTSVELYIILSIYQIPAWQKHWISRELSFIINRFGILYFIFFIDWINYHLIFLSNQMKLIVSEYSTNYTVINMERLSIAKLKILKDIHNMLIKTSNYLNRRFPFFLLFFIITTIICVTCDLYWIFAYHIFANNSFMIGKCTYYYYSFQNVFFQQ